MLFLLLYSWLSFFYIISINVIVKSAELSADEVAQIVDIIETQTSYTIDNIKIIPVE